MADRMQGDERVSYDIRYRQGSSPHFKLEDIHFSPMQDDAYFNVPKMILIEKQPRYPVYQGKIMDKISSMFSDVLKKSGNSLMAGLSGQVSDLVGVAGEAAAGYGGNVIVDSFSGDQKKLDAYYSDQNKYLNNIRDLFTTLTTDHIMTYELPFLSEYFVEADGEAGWRHMGVSDMKKRVGNVAPTLARMNVGYPVTPNWEYSPMVPNFTYRFHLINDTTRNLENNVKFLVHLVPGMMHVLLSWGTTVVERQDTGDVVRDTVASANAVANNLLSNYMSLFKSPNVYEVMVPGRFRWLWCTLKVDVTYKGKVFHDTIRLGDGFGGKVKAFDDGAGVLVGFPEMFEVEVSVRSLLPQSFNEYFYFLQSKPDSAHQFRTLTADQVESEAYKVAGAGMSALNAAASAVQSGMQNMDTIPVPGRM